ncbi:MAG: hypothetical protein ABI720_04840 [Actinomycetes bacterium]
MYVLIWSVVAVLTGFFSALLFEDLLGSEVEGIHDALVSHDGMDIGAEAAASRVSP